MDRLTWTCWGLMLSVLSVAVVAYRNDLSSTRHGCTWSTIDTTMNSSTIANNINVKENIGAGSGSKSSGSILGIPRLLDPSPISLSSGSSSGLSSNTLGLSLNCNLRTLNANFWNYTFNREQIEKTRVVKVKCSDKLFFESILSPNQTLSQLRNLKEIQIESCKIRKMPSRVWASLKNLKTLSLRSQNGEWPNVGLEIEEDSFEGLSQLETLDLSQNNIWTLPENKNVLCHLKRLSFLNVSHNRLSDIDDLSYHDSSSGLSTTNNRDNYCALNLQKLDLSYNHLRRVGPDAFSRISRKLTQIHFQNNLLEELDDSAFGGLGHLRVLNLSSNKLVALPPSIFKYNTNLQELSIQNNSISALSKVFSNLENLMLLDLSENLLSSQWIKEDIFHGLIRLIVLRLPQNQLTYIDSVIFRDLISLQSLILHDNRIETINPDAFQTLTNLHTLDLSRNRLTFVDSKLFSRLFVMEQLWLSHNKIRKMEDMALKNCTSLKDLGLANNLFQDFPQALSKAGLSQLLTLDIGENRISSVSNNSFAGMSQLYGLRVVDNRLTVLPPGFCDPLRKLRLLNLSQNRIKEISSEALKGCPELRVLRLDTNALEDSLPLNLASQLPSILWLNVSQNRLRELNYHSLPSSIEWLDVSYNLLETLSGPLTLGGDIRAQNNINSKNTASNPLYNLRVLDVSHNKLKKLDKSALPSSLETLKANHNELNRIETGTFHQSSRIRRVELMGNKIENLPLASIRVPQIPQGNTLPEFYLGNNPFICDCSMEWLGRVNQITQPKTHPRIVDLDAIVCRTFSKSVSSTVTSIPIIASGSSAQVTIATSNNNNNNTYAVIPLVEMRPKDFLCTYKSHCFALCHCCEFEACDCQMTCPTSENGDCTCYHDTAWSSNIVQCSNLNYENIPARIPMDATEVYLDGNRIFELGSHIFIGKKNLRALYLNDSHVEFIRNKTFNNLKSLEVLRLDDNLLTELQGFEFSDLENLRELYLHNNLLRFIAPSTFSNLKFLQVLRLDGNLLVDFSVWALSGNIYLNSVMISENPWSCDCEYLSHFQVWVSTKTSIVVDYQELKCQENPSSEDDDADVSNTGLELIHNIQSTISSMCTEITFNYNQQQQGGNGINNHISAIGEGGAGEKVASTIPQGPSSSENHLNFSRLETDSSTNTLLILSLSAILIIVIILLVVFRQEVYDCFSNALANSSLLCWCCSCFQNNGSKITCPSSGTGGEALDDSEKLFDAYFIYSQQDEELLLQKVVPELENQSGCSDGQKRLRICLHYRDLCLSAGSPWNREMILSACDASKRVVLVLSRTFLQSEWASSIHFRTSIQSAISLHQKKLIIILLPPFTDQNLSTVSPELTKGSSIRKNSCLEWTNKNFWSRFRRLLPAPGVPTMDYHQQQMIKSCDLNQLPYNVVINSNIHQIDQLRRTNGDNANNSHHYHKNIIPYQIPNHQIVLPAPSVPMNWDQSSNTNSNGLFNPNPHHQHHHSTLSNSNSNHNAIILPNNHSQSTIHPIPSQLTPQPFGYNNEAFLVHQQTSNRNHHPHQLLLQNHHHPHPGHNNNLPIHFSSQNPQTQQPPPPGMMMLPTHNNNASCVIPPHSHSASQLSNANSNFSTSNCYHPDDHHNPHQQPHHHLQMEQNYSSSAVSSCANEEFDHHVYSTLDSPSIIQSPGSMISSQNVVGFCPNGGGGSCGCDGSNSCGSDENCQYHHNGNYNVNQHRAQNSTSSGISSGSDLTCSGGDTSSNAVSPSSPIKNGIFNKLNANCSNSRNSTNDGDCVNNNKNNNGKMYFV